jgi:hypothetical protein
MSEAKHTATAGLKERVLAATGADRVQRRRTAGWRMPENTVYVGRPSRWGNPWTVKDALAVGYTNEARIRVWCVELFREWVGRDQRSLTVMLGGGEALLTRLEAGLPLLRGKNLCCWCALDQPCHADVLLELANADEAGGVNEARVMTNENGDA